MIKRKNIPTIFGVIVLLIGTFAGVFLLNARQVFRIGASVGSEPKDVRVSNISHNSATVSWTTDADTLGFIMWGEAEGSINKIENENANNEKYSTHSLNITGLKSNTQYSYKINSEGALFDNNGVPWQFTTGPDLGQAGGGQVISGSVISASGEPIKRAIVYITAQGYLASTLTSGTGNFVYQLGSIRTSDLQGYAEINPSQTLLEISVIAGKDGVTSAQVFPQGANPIKPMVIGKVYDLRNQESSGTGQSPDADLSLPEDASKESGFNVDTGDGTKTTTTVILESIDDGEIVTSTEPQFFGKGPAGTEVTISVHSEEEIIDTVKIPSNGSWNWTVPDNLTPGAHTITLTWKDASGITRSLTRNFVVQASDLPAFEASRSATVKPSATPKSSATPSATPRVSATPIATGTAPPIPETGELTPTLLFTIMGLIVMTLSFYIWKESAKE